jgi:hypothetical protein
LHGNFPRQMDNPEERKARAGPCFGRPAGAYAAVREGISYREA